MSELIHSFESGEVDYTRESIAKVHRGNNGKVQESDKPLVSLIVPAYNEAAIIEEHLDILYRYMESIEDEYRWEILVINDGSKDNTGELADNFASKRQNIYIFHHRINGGLGKALRTGFKNSKGDYLVTFDLDLSYSEYHIRKLLDKIKETEADVVVASPYMKGGRVSNVPWLRLKLSIWANRFLSATAKNDLVTLTGMVRVYDAKFLRSLNLRSQSMEINPEVIHKLRILGAQIEEMPAHLHWRALNPNHPKPEKPSKKSRRKSSMKILKHTWSIVFAGFIFRPVMFFLIPGLLSFILSLYANTWALIHCFRQYQILAQSHPFADPTEAVARAFAYAPHTFFIGGMTLMVAIQLFSLGILSMQSKSYFEEIFYLGTQIYKGERDKRE